jgi:transcriptional regulator with XRE-family HTH domain
LARRESSQRVRTESPILRRTQLGVRLRQLRQAKDLKLAQVAERLEVSASTLSRLEAGKGSVKERDVRDLCDIYGAGADERDRLMRLARQSHEQAWWQHRDLPEKYLGLEAAASTIRDFKSDIVPGILQTDRYAQAVIGVTLPPEETTPTVVDELAATRAARRQILTREAPVRLRVVFDEAAVCRVVGGPSVMREQLAALIEDSKLPNVELRMLPFSAGAHPAMTSNFTILHLDQPLTPDIVYVEGLLGHRYLDTAAEIDRYGEIFARISDLSLSERETVNKLATIARSVGRNVAARERRRA